MPTNRRRYEIILSENTLVVYCRECDEDVAYHASPVGVEEELEEDMERHDKAVHGG